MVRPKSTRTKKKHDYAALSRGLISTAAASQQDDEYIDLPSSDTGSPLTTESGVSESKKPSVDPDSEIKHLEAIKAGLEASKKDRERAQKRERLVKDIEKLRIAEQFAGQQSAPNVFANNFQLPVQPSFPGQPSFPVQPSFPGHEDVSVKDLRNITRLNNDAEAHLARYGVGYEGQDPFSSSQPFSFKPYQFNGKGPINSFSSKNNFSSGRDSRARDCVVTPVIWPQTKLTYSYTSTDLTYQKLDLPLLGAGEIAVILASGPSEHRGRLKLLQRVLYHAKDYTWNACRNFHESILLEIERGERSWDSSDYRDIEAGVLFRHPLTTTSYSTKSTGYNNSQRPNNRRFFCLEWNRDTCHHAGTHSATVGTQVQRVEHFCAKCWRRERISREHRESSSSCPHKDN